MPTLDLGEIKGQPGQPGRDALINGMNTIEIVEGDRIEIKAI